MADATKDTRAWGLLCARLGRDPQASEESDTCTLRAAWKAMMAFSTQEAASPTLLEALERVIAEKAPAYHDCTDNGESECAWCEARAAITLATGKDA